MAFPWLWEPSRDLPLLGIHSHIMAAGGSGIPVHPGSSWRDAIALKPPKADVTPVGS